MELCILEAASILFVEMHPHSWTLFTYCECIELGLMYPPLYFMNYIYSGSLYDSELENDFALLDFQDFLEQNVLVNSSDLTDLIRRLTPSCEDLTVSCHWRNEERSCMTESANNSALLLSRRTRYGFCCTFNYNRRDNFTASLT